NWLTFTNIQRLAHTCSFSLKALRFLASCKYFTSSIASNYKNHGSSSEFVCSDMWQPYLDVIRQKCSQALHILDRFHVVAKMKKVWMMSAPLSRARWPRTATRRY